MVTKSLLYNCKAAFKYHNYLSYAALCEILSGSHSKETFFGEHVEHHCTNILASCY